MSGCVKKNALSTDPLPVNTILLGRNNFLNSRTAGGGLSRCNAREVSSSSALDCAGKVLGVSITLPHHVSTHACSMWLYNQGADEKSLSPLKNNFTQPRRSIGNCGHNQRSVD